MEDRFVPPWNQTPPRVGTGRALHTATLDPEDTLPRCSTPKVLLGLTLIALAACDGRAVILDGETSLTGYLCSSHAMQASPWVARGGLVGCGLDAFLSSDASCTGEVVRLCSTELPAGSVIPWGQLVTVSGAYEEAEICMIGHKGETASCEMAQRFVPASLAAHR